MTSPPCGSIIESPKAEQVCDDCGSALHDIGTEVSTRLEYIPAHLITAKFVDHLPLHRIERQ